MKLSEATPRARYLASRLTPVLVLLREDPLGDPRHLGRLSASEVVVDHDGVGIRRGVGPEIRVPIALLEVLEGEEALPGPVRSLLDRGRNRMGAQAGRIRRGNAGAKVFWLGLARRGGGIQANDRLSHSEKAVSVIS